MSIAEIDRRVDYLCNLADRSYEIPGERERIQVEVDRLMDQRDEIGKSQLGGN